MKANCVVFLAVVLILAGCSGGAGPSSTAEKAPVAAAPAVTAAPAPAPAPAPVAATAPAKPAAAQPKAAGDVTVAEVEDFNLAGCKVVDVPTASGGKVVVLDGADSKAKGSVNLAPGSYLVSAYVLAPSPEEDAFGLAVGTGSSHRLYPEEQGVISAVDAGRYTQEALGPCNIEFTFQEPKVQLDRVEFKKAP